MYIIYTPHTPHFTYLICTDCDDLIRPLLQEGLGNTSQLWLGAVQLDRVRMRAQLLSVVHAVPIVAPACEKTISFFGVFLCLS